MGRRDEVGHESDCDERKNEVNSKKKKMKNETATSPNADVENGPMQFMEVILILMFQTSTPSFNKTMQSLCDQISAGTHDTNNRIIWTSTFGSSFVINFHFETDLTALQRDNIYRTIARWSGRCVSFQEPWVD